MVEVLCGRRAAASIRGMSIAVRGRLLAVASLLPRWYFRGAISGLYTSSWRSRWMGDGIVIDGGSGRDC
jgi:hypothetical protein